MYLPYVIKYNAKDPVAAKRYAEIARRMGLAGTSEQALINSLVREDRRLQCKAEHSEDSERLRNQ